MTEERPEERQEQQEATEEHSRRTMEKFWDATVDTWHTATFKAAKYSRLVQKKIDLNSLHKKISSTHTELGKMIDDLHQRGEKEFLDNADISGLLAQLTDLRQQAAALEEEIIALRTQETPPEEKEDTEPPAGTA